MINAAHFILSSTDAEADRAFFRDVLGLPHVDAGRGWLIFRLPPAEVAVHPAEHNDEHALYLMTDDLKAEIAALKQKGVTCSAVTEERWGSVTYLDLPGGGKLGLYQPKHPVAHSL